MDTHAGQPSKLLPGGPVQQETLSILSEADVHYAPYWARKLAFAFGLPRKAQWEVAVAVSEASTNILKFGNRGAITLRLVPGPPLVLELEAVDQGPGIPDPALSREDGVSEGKRRCEATSLRGFRGLGTGLGAIGRLMDELTIQTRPQGGTRLLARKQVR